MPLPLTHRVLLTHLIGPGACACPEPVEDLGTRVDPGLLWAGRDPVVTVRACLLCRETVEESARWVLRYPFPGGHRPAE